MKQWAEQDQMELTSVNKPNTALLNALWYDNTIINVSKSVDDYRHEAID
jgi:hypothetical protein